MSYGYTFNKVNNTLLAYCDIALGYDVVFDDDEPSTSKDVFRSPFENAIIRKADIDMAIDRMGSTPGAWLEFCHNIDNNSQDKLSSKQKRILKHINFESPINWKGELMAPVTLIKEIVSHLNGTYKKPALASLTI